MTVYITNMQKATPVAPLTLNEGWSQITALLTHLEDGLFGAGPDNPSAFTPAMYAEVHGIAYAMCTQKLSLCPDLYRRIGIHAAEVARKAYVNEGDDQRHSFQDEEVHDDGGLAMRSAIRDGGPREKREKGVGGGPLTNTLTSRY